MDGPAREQEEVHRPLTSPLALPAHRFKLAPGWSVRVWRGRGLSNDTSKLPARATVADWRGPLTQLLADSEALPEHQCLKYSPDGEVCSARISIGGKAIQVVCKQSRVRGFMASVIAALKPTRGERNRRRADWLLRAGINTPAPLAVLERRWPRRESWFVVEFLPTAVDLDQVVLAHWPQLGRDQARGIKDRLIDRVVACLIALEGVGLHHRDLKAPNLLIEDWAGRSGGPRVWLVDLDGIGRRPGSLARWRWQPLVRLAASVATYDGVTRTDRLRFLKRYLRRTGLDASTWKRHWRQRAKETRDYLVRSRRRKRHKIDGFTAEP